MSQIHWVGGNLPQIGKAWTVRALAESLYLQHNMLPIIVDTSSDSPLSSTYNPGLKYLHGCDPSKYFKPGYTVAADEIFDLVTANNTIIIKLSSYSQSAFLNWVNTTGILGESIRQDFWFVTNGHRDSLRHFQEICSYPWNLTWVRNHYNKIWEEIPETDEEELPFKICDLPVTLTPNETSYIEDSKAILCQLAHPQNSQLSLFTRTRIQRFLNQSSQNLLGSHQSPNPMQPPLAQAKPSVTIPPPIVPLETAEMDYSLIS
jgi:hypothetical protein